MRFPPKTIVLTAVVALGVLALTAQAQPQPQPQSRPPNPNFRVTPTGPSINGAAAYNNLAASRNNVAASRVALNNSYLGSNYYGASVDPYGGYLSGAADVINAQGNFMISGNQAELIHEQVKSARIDNRRKSFDEYQYERANTPTREDERERTRLENLRRSLNDPPVTEIWSGQALNVLLSDCQQMYAHNVRGPVVPLDQTVVSHINVTLGLNSASIGPLKNDGKLTWPLLLKGSGFKAERDRMNELAPKAVREAGYGEVDADTLNGLVACVNALTADLKGRVADVPIDQYLAARRYLHELEDAVRVLQTPDASRMVTKRLAARGTTVGDLVDEMTRQGLKFAAAVTGDQSYYTALHSAMAVYATGSAQLTATAPR